MFLTEAAHAASTSSVYNQLLESLDNIVTNTSSIPAVPSSEIEYTGNHYVWPTTGTVTSPFGQRTHPVFGDQRLHRGIDIGVDYGSRVVAAKSGIVTYAGWAEGYGKTIIVEHNDGYSTLYGHNSELLVSPGTVVRQGQIIARTGDTGTTTGPVLHFEVRKSGRAIDPIRVLV
jgi:murein DD-endopeptidase MepM/ murein hydrolase activator NlpD